MTFEQALRLVVAAIKGRGLKVHSVGVYGLGRLITFGPALEDDGGAQLGLADTDAGFQLSDMGQLGLAHQGVLAADERWNGEDVTSDPSLVRRLSTTVSRQATPDEVLATAGWLAELVTWARLLPAERTLINAMAEKAQGR